MAVRKPTMKDVAIRAGVTQPTVSYVINGTANISDEVRKKVFAAIEELGYKPNVYARILRTSHTNIIGIIIPDISNQYYASIVGILEKDLSEHQKTVLIGSTDYSPVEEEKIIRQILSYNIDGIIIAYQLMNDGCWETLRKSGCRIVSIEGGHFGRDFYAINIDNHLGGYTATHHLLEKERKNIIYVGQNVMSDILQERTNGYIDAMREANLPHTVLTTVGSGNMWQEGAKIGEKLKYLHCDGIVASSDILAVGIIREFLTEGIRVPEDIAVVGYDDIPLSELFVPSLTTVRQPMRKACTLAVEGIMNEDAPQTACVTIQPCLIVRDST